MIRRVGLVLVIAALVVTAGASAGTLVAPQESTSLDTVDSVQDNDTDTGDNETDTNETDVGDNETDTGDNETDTGNETDQAQQEQRLTFNDQETNGSTVVVEQVEMEEDGFLVIHDDSLLAGNVVGSVVGVSHYLEAGTHENVTVHLHGDVSADQETEVVVGGMQENETDDNETDVTDNETDTNETDTNETDTNETDTNETDTNETDTTGDNETDTTGDNETDTTGDNETDTNETATTGNETDAGPDETTLIAMPHVDSNGNQQYDFVISEGELDGPVTADGSALTAQATVTIVDRLSEERANVVFNDQTLGGQAGDTGADTTGNESDTTGDNETDTGDNETDTNETDTTGNESDTNETDTTGNETDTNETDTTGDNETDTTGDNETETGNETAGTAQAVEEGTVTVDSVTLTRPGYVVLMDDRGNIVGVSEYLEPETHENLEIELTRSVLATSSPDGNTTVTMTATLHMETTNNQVFEYAISNDVDVPFQNFRGQEVSDTAEIAVDTGEEDAETEENETDTGNETDTTGDESDGNETDTTGNETDTNETDTNESDTNESDS